MLGIVSICWSIFRLVSSIRGLRMANSPGSLPLKPFKGFLRDQHLLLLLREGAGLISSRAMVARLRLRAPDLLSSTEVASTVESARCLPHRFVDAMGGYLRVRHPLTFSDATPRVRGTGSSSRHSDTPDVVQKRSFRVYDVSSSTGRVVGRSHISGTVFRWFRRDHRMLFRSDRPT